MRGTAQCSRGLRGAQNRSWAVQSSASPCASPSPAIKWGEALLPGGQACRNRHVQRGRSWDRAPSETPLWPSVVSLATARRLTGSLGMPRFSLEPPPRGLYLSSLAWVCGCLWLGQGQAITAWLLHWGRSLTQQGPIARLGSEAPFPAGSPLPALPTSTNPGQPTQSLPRAPFFPYRPQEPLGV